jgi:hypothetical protein
MNTEFSHIDLNSILSDMMLVLRMASKPDIIQLEKSIEKVMSAIVEAEATLEQVLARVATIAAFLQQLRDLIKQLQASQGPWNDIDQAALNKIESIATQMDTATAGIDLTPPVVEVPPPTVPPVTPPPVDVPPTPAPQVRRR